MNPILDHIEHNLNTPSGYHWAPYEFHPPHYTTYSAIHLHANITLLLQIRLREDYISIKTGSFLKPTSTEKIPLSDPELFNKLQTYIDNA